MSQLTQSRWCLKNTSKQAEQVTPFKYISDQLTILICRLKLEANPSILSLKLGAIPFRSYRVFYLVLKSL